MINQCVSWFGKVNNRFSPGYPRIFKNLNKYLDLPRGAEWMRYLRRIISFFLGCAYGDEQMRKRWPFSRANEQQGGG